MSCFTKKRHGVTELLAVSRSETPRHLGPRSPSAAPREPKQGPSHSRGQATAPPSSSLTPPPALIVHRGNQTLLLPVKKSGSKGIDSLFLAERLPRCPRRVPDEPRALQVPLLRNVSTKNDSVQLLRSPRHSLQATGFVYLF